MASPAITYTSAEDYLAAERNAFEKHEYFRGEVVAMAGARIEHVRIARNLISEIASFLKGKSCEIFADFRVTTPLSDAYMYPDATIVCGSVEEKKDCFDTLVNPSVIIEILSPSTSGYDKSYKLLYYLQIPSLSEYILVDSAQYKITTFRRTETGLWDIFTTSGIDGKHTIHAIQYELSMKDVYYKVEVGRQFIKRKESE